ncbi:MAG: DUF72 domain-containing protein [Syntrophales bacterium]
MKIHVGTSGYGYKEWKGKFYPPQIRAAEMLRFYAERLATVEINNTFYRMPTENLLRSWAGQVPDDFLFAFKAPQVITHLKRLRNVDEETGYLFRTLSILGGRLGPVLFQFPQSFRPDPAKMEYFLGLIPGGVDCAFEFRSAARPDATVLAILGERGYSLCVADTDEEPVEEIAGGASWGYLRLRRSAYPEADLVGWRERIRAQKWKRAYVFFKHEEEAKGPEAAIRFRELSLP